MTFPTSHFPLEMIMERIGEMQKQNSVIQRRGRISESPRRESHLDDSEEDVSHDDQYVDMEVPTRRQRKRGFLGPTINPRFLRRSWGHETPYSIKLSQERELTRSKSRDDLELMTSGDLDAVETHGVNQKCEFYLKQKKSPKKHSLDNNSSYQKSMKKKKKSDGIFNQFLKRFRQPQSHIFGQNLAEIFDENKDPPEPIMKLMVLVYKHGPRMNGIMRKGNNAGLAKEIKEKIESDSPYTMEDHQAPTAASVFKEFLRHIPDGLLPDSFREQWTNAMLNETDDDARVEKIKMILKDLPQHNYRLLMYTISLLQHLAKHREVTNMGPENLAVCITPSIFSGLPGQDMTSSKRNDPEAIKQSQESVHVLKNVYNPLITFMICKHIEIFGEEILNMFIKFNCKKSTPVNLEDTDQDQENRNIPAATFTEDETEEDIDEDEDEETASFSSQQFPQRLRSRHRQFHQHSQRNSNSGTDSDSTHSVLSMPDTGVRRDDSSVDSLVDREYYPAENDSSPKLVNSHLSPSNLSRDSGLTLSDNQLYDEDGDIPTTMSGRTYGRSSSHYDELENSSPHMFSKSMDSKRDFRQVPNPVPPPRIKATKKTRVNSDDTKAEQYPVYPTPHPFKHSASTTQLDIYTLSRSARDSKSSAGDHVPLGKRISSNSIGEEIEPQNDPFSIPDLKRIQQSQNMGTIVKTDSGTHLYLHDDPKYNMDSVQRREVQLIRQTSATDSTPPISPQSHLSYSSRDSILSDNLSRDSPFHSAPQTPDSPSDKIPSWTPHPGKAFKPWNDRPGNSLNLSHESGLSKSTSDILRDDIMEDESTFHTHFESPSESVPHISQKEERWTDDHIQKYKPSTQSFGKSHEAEEIDTSSGLHFSLMTQSDTSSIEEEIVSVSQNNKRMTEDSSQQRSGRYHQLLQGSPPPNVVLQNLQGPLRRESVPMKASYDEAIVAQLRRSSHDHFNYPHPVDPAKSMNNIRHDEYQRASSKPIMMSPLFPVDEQSNRVRSPKFLAQNMEDSSKMGKDTASDTRRPDKPPCYQQALQRNFMIKQNLPVDIAIDNKAHPIVSSSRAMNMYEKSLELYNEQRKSSSKSNVGSESVESDLLQSQKSKMSSVINSNVNKRSSVDGSHSGASKDVASPHSYNDSAALGFLDLGHISQSLQEDVITQRNAHADGNLGLDTAARSVSINRTDSKLSDTGSSSGSSVTVSTLSHRSDSFCHPSDVSNVTVSSLSSSDSNSDITVLPSSRHVNSGLENHNMAYSRHFSPVEPTGSVISKRHDSETEEEEEERYEEDVYIVLRKDPNELYRESKKRFEENLAPSHFPETHVSNAITSPLSLSSSSSSSSSCPSSSLTPRSNIETLPVDSEQHNVAFQPPHKTLVSKPEGRELNSPPQSSNQRTVTRPKPSQQSQLLGYLSSSLPVTAKTCLNKPEISKGNENERKVEVCKDELPADHHSNFLKTRSLFYHPEDERTSSPSSFLSHSVNSHASSLPNPSDNPVKLDMSVKSYVNPDSDISSKPVYARGDKSNVSSSENKREISWSVKNLRQKYDIKQPEDSQPANNNSKSTSFFSVSTEPTSTAMRPRSPPPYQNPPPFKRTPGTSRASTSSTSSTESDANANKFMNNSRKTSRSNFGPKANGIDECISCSSSEDGYNSSLDRKSRRSSLQELNCPIDHSNITYV